MFGIPVRPWPMGATVVLALVLAGCTSADAATGVTTYTLRTAEYSYSGYLVPKRVQKLAIPATQSKYPDGAAVQKGVSLVRTTGSVTRKLRTLERRLTRYQDRAQLAKQHLASLAAGRISTGFTPDRAIPSADVRAIEREIAATLLAYRRAAAQYQHDLHDLRAQKPVGGAAKAERKRDIAQLGADHRLANAETVNQLEGSFENLASECTRLARETTKALDRSRAEAPWDGTVAISGTEVSLHSAAYTFVYVATEDHVDALSEHSDLELRVGSTIAGRLELATTEYSAESTTNDRSPRYELTFDVVQPADDFRPRDHGAAALVYSGAGVVVPDGFLGTDGSTQYVQQNGVRREVQVAKDADGQFVVTDGSLRNGDVIEKVDP